ncbi:MAG: hypothetical protein JO102_04055, partial [Elusimicrobia bacterium]|nr:hypothetical protein [Elusimicrobiota bacterium]
MRTRGISRPTVVLGLLLPVVACVPSLKPLPRAELERPQKVVLVTVARDPAAVSNWHPGLSLGLGFGSFGSSVSGGVDLSQQRDPFSAAVVEDLKSWDFRPALQRVMLARPAPGAWTWVDGDSLDGAVLNEIDAAHGKPNAPMPLTQAWADKNGVDKILVVDPA